MSAAKAKHPPKSHMTADQFRKWRKSLSFKQKDAAERLGLQKRMIQYYEKGHRDGKPVHIPKSVRLACYALMLGVEDYNGEAVETAERDDTRKTVETPSAMETMRDKHALARD